MKNIFIKSMAISAFVALTGCGGSSSGDTSNDSSDGGSAPEEVKVVAVEAGVHSTMYIKSDGSLWGVGINDKGQLGDASNTNRSEPIEIMSSGVQSVSTSRYHTMIVKTDGSLWATGYNFIGQLGNGAESNVSTPIEILSSGVKSVSAGYVSTLVLKTDGTLWVTGGAGYLPISGDRIKYNELKEIEQDVESVSASDSTLFHLAVKTDGSLVAVGTNGSGQLGNGSTDDISGIYMVEVVSSGVASVSAGGAFTMFIKDNGSLWGMGASSSGQLGTGYGDSLSNQTSPVQMLASDVEAVYTGSSHTMILKTDGSLWAAGNGDNNRLGTGSTTNYLTPTEIISSGVSMAAAGAGHTVILKDDGSVWAVGLNNYGQLGDGSEIDALTLIEITLP
jgi:alpha-tubulin suppressor-like RCC1 family protein